MKARSIKGRLQVLFLRYRVWRASCALKKGIAEVQKMTPEEAAPVLRRWRWDARHIDDEKFREALLDSIGKLEQHVALKARQTA